MAVTSEIAKSVLPKERKRSCRCGEHFSIKVNICPVCGIEYSKRCRRNLFNNLETGVSFVHFLIFSYVGNKYRMPATDYILH